MTSIDDLAARLERRGQAGQTSRLTPESSRIAARPDIRWQSHQTPAEIALGGSSLKAPVK